MICTGPKGLETNKVIPALRSRSHCTVELTPVARHRLHASNKSASSCARRHAQSASRRRFLPLFLAPLGLSWAESGKASKLGPGVDKVWEGIGGGPADLYFPDDFLGTWDVVSSLANLELPLGPEFVPDMKVVNQSRAELGKNTMYSVRFFESDRNQVITDRRFNTASLIEMYYGPMAAVTDSIEWDPQDPNVLSLNLPDKTSVYTRVTRRSSKKPAEDRLETSEYYEMVYDSSAYPSPKVTASQCFTKYKWRPKDVAVRDRGPVIIATQVISDYLTASAGEQMMMEARGRPVVIKTYRMAFREHNPTSAG